ncbi:hypothetical protein [Micromonospora craniellae]|uniref:Uncharacterized protein n=1 Tax=Micromonospora craniellae TaxID=2294034 RepID=A0A372G619_9ACTN|nr:hypothetical protein [Micromonospora craniellae]QOC90247.1 hypothetical protein ID554_18860 [Micromonospora craniellae]RFS48364.1 hypothetical protein D0Q02_02490 [Micromonospora craniellae]
MGRKYLFSEDSNGRAREVKVDPKHLDKQIREERAAGRTPTVLDEDERIRFGQLAQNLRDNG